MANNASYKCRHVWIMSTMRGSTLVQQLYVKNKTTAWLLLLLFFSMFIDGWKTLKVHPVKYCV